METIAYGHGIATTILQLAKGYSIITMVVMILNQL